MANETDPVLIKAVKWLQLRQESLKDGFIVDYKGGEYIFVPEYIDRFTCFLYLIACFPVYLLYKYSPDIFWLKMI